MLKTLLQQEVPRFHPYLPPLGEVSHFHPYLPPFGEVSASTLTCLPWGRCHAFTPTCLPWGEVPCFHSYLPPLGRYHASTLTCLPWGRCHAVAEGVIQDFLQSSHLPPAPDGCSLPALLPGHCRHARKYCQLLCLSPCR